MVVKYREFTNTLNVATFNGLQFIWRSTNGFNTGRQTNKDQYDGSNGNAKLQDQGAKLLEISCTIEPITQTIDAKDELLNALVLSQDLNVAEFEDNLGGELILPDYKSFNVVATDVSIANAESELNRYVFNVVFTATSKLEFPINKNTLGGTDNLSSLTNTSVIKNLADNINNINLVDIEASFTELVDYVIYDFVNQNDVLSAIRNVDRIATTIKESYGNEDQSTTISPVGAGGVIALRPNLNSLVIDKNIILAKIISPITLATVIGNIYTELGFTTFNNLDTALLLYKTLANISFDVSGDLSKLVQDTNSKTLEYYNRKLALIQYCVVAINKTYLLQEEITAVIDTIITLQTKLLNYTNDDLIEVFDLINATLDILKTQKTASYRINQTTVNNIDIMNLVYILFNEVRDSEVSILKSINPNKDYGCLDGNINILVVNQ